MSGRFCRFALVGCLGTVVQLAVVAVLPGMPVTVASAISVEVAVLHNFVWHEGVTWRERRRGTVWWRLWRFQAGNGLVSLVGNPLIAYWLVENWRLSAVLAGLVGIAVCAAVNFVLAERWVYR